MKSVHFTLWSGRLRQWHPLIFSILSHDMKWMIGLDNCKINKGYSSYKPDAKCMKGADIQQLRGQSKRSMTHIRRELHQSSLNNHSLCPVCSHFPTTYVLKTNKTVGEEKIQEKGHTKLIFVPPIDRTH
jgi:hypothetical protein